MLGDSRNLLKKNCNCYWLCSIAFTSKHCAASPWTAQCYNFLLILSSSNSPQIQSHKELQELMRAFRSELKF